VLLIILVLNLGLENPDESQEYILAYLPVTKHGVMQ
jgi:hypothetical protein